METHGMVVKIKGRSCIVLTPGGEYRKVPLPRGSSTKVGQEIRLEKRKSLPYLRYVMVAASLLIFVLAGQLYLWQTPPAAAYMTIDINPSIELAVAADRRVISARGLNSDGEKILTQVKIKKRDLREAVEQIIAQAVADQYLGVKDDNVILATLTVDNGTEPVVDLESVYDAIKNPVASGGVDAEVIIEPVEPGLRQEAAKAGISTGRYFLVQKSDQKGVPISISEVGSMSLGKLAKEKKISVSELVDEDNHDDDRETKDKKANIIVKRSIYADSYHIKENAGDSQDGEFYFNGGKQQNSSQKRDTPGHTVKIQTEERQDKPENNSNNNSSNSSNNSGKHKTVDINRAEQDSNDHAKSGHLRKGHGD